MVRANEGPLDVVRFFRHTQKISEQAYRKDRAIKTELGRECPIRTISYFRALSRAGGPRDPRTFDLPKAPPGKAAT